jgi:hypothetical protein
VDDRGNDPDWRSGRILLAGLHARLQLELEKLGQKRWHLKRQQEALGKELQGVDVEVQATRRMLGLVEATEQQLRDKGRKTLKRVDHEMCTWRPAPR